MDRLPCPHCLRRRVLLWAAALALTVAAAGGESLSRGRVTAAPATAVATR